MTSNALRAPIRHPDALAVGRAITLGAAEARALQFRELRVKEAFTLVDRDGAYFRASIRALALQGAEAVVYEAMPAPTESPARITLVCAVLARQRMLGVVQKATELGVQRVWPVLTEHSVPASGLAHEKAHAWPAQAIRACRQSRRASVPDVREAVPLDVALDDPAVASSDVRVVLDDGAGGAWVEPRLGVAAPTRIVLAVGPEGGFSDAERAQFLERGFASTRLGGRVLRAETAVLVGLALLQRAHGDLRGL